MGREIVTEDDVLTFRQEEQAVPPAPSFGTAPSLAAVQPPAPKRGKAPSVDTYEARLFKLIPSEVIAMYIFLDGVMRSAPANVPAQAIRWAVFGTLLCGTWFYLERVADVSKKAQLAASTLAFAVWVFSLGGPFAAYPWYSYIYGAVLLPLYTFGVAIVLGEKTESKKIEAERSRRAAA
jgi:hypothetical protein